MGRLIGQSRTSPRAVQIGNMLLQLDDAQPPLPPPESVPQSTDMGKMYEEIMRELNAKNDEAVASSHQKSDLGRTIQRAEAELQNAQHRLVTEARQRDIAMGMANISVYQY